jgi:hypothetical protein
LTVAVKKLTEQTVGMMATAVLSQVKVWPSASQSGTALAAFICAITVSFVASPVRPSNRPDEVHDGRDTGPHARADGGIRARGRAPSRANRVMATVVAGDRVH